MIEKNGKWLQNNLRIETFKTIERESFYQNRLWDKKNIDL